jgi:hypothetical protein
MFTVVAVPAIGGGTGQNGIMGLSTTGPEDSCEVSTADPVPLFKASGIYKYG